MPVLARFRLPAQVFTGPTRHSDGNSFSWAKYLCLEDCLVHFLLKSSIKALLAQLQAKGNWSPVCKFAPGFSLGKQGLTCSEVFGRFKAALSL